MRTKDQKPRVPGYTLEHLTHRPFDTLKDQLKTKRRKAGSSGPRIS